MSPREGNKRAGFVKKPIMKMFLVLEKILHMNLTLSDMNKC